MPNSKEVFIAIQEYINSKDVIKLYYEEASKKATFPYGVITDPVETSLRYGNLVYFDINIWSKEPTTGDDLEDIVRKIINLLDSKLFSKRRAVVYFATQNRVSDPEFQLIKKQVTFSIKVF